MKIRPFARHLLYYSLHSFCVVSNSFHYYVNNVKYIIFIFQKQTSEYVI